MNKFTNYKRIIIILLFLFLLSACDIQDASKNNKLNVHFIDVGQADSTLIEFPNNTIALIDGGNREDGVLVGNYLKERKIQIIDFVIATHPHEDHIGGLPYIIKNFNVKEIFMPNITNNTNIFEKLLKEIEAKNMKINIVKSGDRIINEDDIVFEVLAPISDNYADINDYSIVNKIRYKEISFLFTGDIEKKSEEEMLKSDVDLRATVLKIPHHGSSSSSSELFLDKVSPQIAVIFSGEKNSYGHPHEETLEKLGKRKIQIERTDKIGSFRLSTNGEYLRLYKEVMNNSENNNKTDQIIANISSKVYHYEYCKKLPTEEKRVLLKSIEDAENQGYRMHENCIK